MKMKFHLLMFVCSVLITNILAQKLEFNIVTAKNLFLFGETIDVGITLKNNGKLPIQISNPHPTLSTLKLEIVNDKRDTIAYTGLIGCSVIKEGDKESFNKIELRPDQDFYLLLPLDEFYGLGCAKNLSSRCINVGDYTVQAVFYNDKLTILSNKINIKVENPTGSELELFNSFIRITDSLDFSDKRIIRESCSAYIALTEENPNSVYIPSILVKTSSIFNIRLDDYDKAKQIYRKILEEYSYSSKGIHYLDTLLNSISEKSEKLAYLEKLKQSSKGSLMERIFEEKIKTLIY